MAKNAVALIVAGSGDVAEQEVNDLLLDRWPDEDFIIDLVVPVQKDWFTPTVETVVDWFDDDKNVYTIREKEGSNLSRRSSKLGQDEPQEFDNLAQVFDPEDFKDWDEVHFLVALPEDPEDPDYDLYAGLVEAAIEGGFSVLNLCRGLDDVRLEDPEPEPEPEPDPKELSKMQPKRRSRKKASDDMPVEEKFEPDYSDVKGSPVVDRENPDPRLQQALEALGDVARFLSTVDESNALIHLTEVAYRPLTLKARSATEALIDYVSDPTGEAEPAVSSEGTDDVIAAAGEKKTTGKRGRPRKNFEVSEIWDEIAAAWVSRPKGRLAKGTQTRKVHAETGEVLEEGTV